jgi:hypothetical protein
MIFYICVASLILTLCAILAREPFHFIVLIIVRFATFRTTEVPVSTLRPVVTIQISGYSRLLFALRFAFLLLCWQVDPTFESAMIQNDLLSRDSRSHIAPSFTHLDGRSQICSHRRAILGMQLYYGEYRNAVE